METRKRRPGGGRKRGEPTANISFRVNEKLLEKVKAEHAGSLNAKVNEFLTSLAQSI